MITKDTRISPCPGDIFNNLSCRSILPFPRGFKGSYVDACPGGCEGTGFLTLIAEAKNFIQEYRESLLNAGFDDPLWNNELVESVVKKLIKEENYEDEDHIELVFARDLIYTLEQEVLCSFQ